MPLSFQEVLWLLLLGQVENSLAAYTVPGSAPATAGALDPAPVGVSYVSSFGSYLHVSDT
jgi:hypothetical protein